MRFSILLLSLLLAIAGQSQENYALFRPGVQYVYSHSLPETPATSPLLGIRIDDVPCQFTYESLQPNAPEGDEFCLVRVPAFIGSEICRDGGLTQLNLGSDETPIWLELRTAAPVGTQWLAGLTPDSLFAQVDDVYLGEILGIADSIKAIGLYRKDEAGALIPLYEEAPLLLSQNYGLTRAVFLHWLGAEVGPVELVGMSEPMLGIQNPVRSTTFDLQPSDEFHLKKSHSGTSPDGLFLVTNEQERVSFVEEFWTANNTELNQVFSIDRITYFGGTDPPTDTIREANVLDTLSYYWERLSYLDEQPGALLFDTTSTDLWQTVMLGFNYFCERPAKQLSTEVLLFGEECGQTSFDAIVGDEFYLGLAGPYYAYTDVSGFNFRFRNLRYAALHDGFLCGEPLDFIVGTNAPISNNGINIWPNPVRDDLLWNGPSPNSPLLGTIINAQGQRIALGQIRPEEAINVSFLQSGLYWLELMDSSGNNHFKTPFIKQ